MPSTQIYMSRYLALLSSLLFRRPWDEISARPPDADAIKDDYKFVCELNDRELGELLGLADAHHVTVRALRVLSRLSAQHPGQGRIQSWCETSLAKEHRRSTNAVEKLASICEALESSGSPVTVIKSLDHWPDFGSDLDLYISGDDVATVFRVMTQKFKGRLEPRSWGDRLANKWNFKIPGLPESVEVHVGCLGQTGEQKAMARRVFERSVGKTIGDYCFRVPAPEERVIISTLQRMYRHLYFRLCDMLDFARLLEERAIDFQELRRAADLGGIWPGVATFLLLIVEYVNSHGGHITVPREVLAEATSSELRVYQGGQFLRVPKGPAVGLYGSQILRAGRQGDLRAMLRLPLLPPLAISALLAYRLTGSDKGVW